MKYKERETSTEMIIDITGVLMNQEQEKMKEPDLETDKTLIPQREACLTSQMQEIRDQTMVIG